MNYTVTNAQIKEKYELALKRIREFHLRNIANSPGPVVLISTAYPGVWLEHAFDGVCWGQLNRDDETQKCVAVNQLRLFIDNQLANGHLPYNVLDTELLKQKPWWGRRQIGYKQLQECVSFARLCLDAYELVGDRKFLQTAYAACKGWDAWLCANRMTLGQGLVETFCVYDTGHDNSCRLEGLPNGCPDVEGTAHEDIGGLPLISPDVNAVFYGDRIALSEMAEKLGYAKESADWKQKAESVRRRMFGVLYDEATDFFYDADKSLAQRKIKSISITNVFTEHMLTQAEFDRIYERHMLSPQEFGSEYPFPSVALDDSARFTHADKNCWGYYSQALTLLRAQRWMDFYGRSGDYDRILEKWISVYAAQDEILFSQEIDPYTGVPTDCSRWYSSAMLAYIYGVKRLGLV